MEPLFLFCGCKVTTFFYSHQTFYKLFSLKSTNYLITKEKNFYFTIIFIPYNTLFTPFHPKIPPKNHPTQPKFFSFSNFSLQKHQSNTPLQASTSTHTTPQNHPQPPHTPTFSTKKIRYHSGNGFLIFSCKQQITQQQLQQLHSK